jgi:hypothetical protein
VAIGGCASSSSPATPPAPAAGSPATPATIPVATPAAIPVAKLAALARGSAARFGDPTVASASVIATTRLAAENWMERGSAGPGTPDARAYLILLRGRFVCELCPRPAGAAAPHGGSAQILWVPGHGVTDGGLTRRVPPGIRTLGIGQRITFSPSRVPTPR